MTAVGEVTTCCDDNRHITDIHAPKCQIDSIVSVIRDGIENNRGRDDTDISTGIYGYKGITGSYWYWSSYIVRWERISDCTLRIEWEDYSASCQFFALGDFGGDGCDPYGSFFSTQTQEATESGNLITFNNVKYSRSIYLASATQVKITEPGLYRFSFSCQLNNNDRTHTKFYSETLPPYDPEIAANINYDAYYYYDTIYGYYYNLYQWMLAMFSGNYFVTTRGVSMPKGTFWIRKNGIDIPNTKRVVSNDLTIHCEYYVQMEKDDYVEVMFSKCNKYDYSGGFSFDPEIDKFSIVNTVRTSATTTETTPSIVLNANRITNYLPEIIT